MREAAPSRCVAGIDVGSTLTKVVVRIGAVAGSAIGRTEIDYVAAAARLLSQALERAGASMGQLVYIVATGYGRRGLAFADRQITEITCHARGVRELFPGARTIIDIGGQDAKGIKLGPAGKVLKFVMNDKCAAGTGRFIEVAASTLGLTLDELEAKSLETSSPVSISSVCTVFAEQEFAQHLANGTPLADVLGGLHAALASRVQRMVRTLGIEPAVVFTGGCARNRALVGALQERLGTRLLTPVDPELTGALGAALIAAEYSAEGAVFDSARRLLAHEALAAATASAVQTPAPFFARVKSCMRASEGSFSVRAGIVPAGGPRAGIDAGAISTKAVVVDGERAGFSILSSDGNYAAVASAALEGALRAAGLSAARLARITATGLAASKLAFEFKRDDMSCLAAGVHALFPDAGQAIDIGGHGTRVLRLGPGGGIKDFAATGQCAAGGARILEVIAHLLRLEPGELGEIGLRSTSPAVYSAACSVFAETEAISLLTRGTTPEDLLAGLHQSLAAKIMALARANMRAGARALAGGGAKDTGLVARMRAGSELLLLPPEPMVVAALGAALLAD